MFGVIMKALLDSIATALSNGATGPLDGASLLLFTGAPTLGPDTSVADLVECTFPGYARVPITPWTAVLHPDDTGAYNRYGPVAPFTAGAIVTPETVTGWGIVDGAGTPKLLSAGYFATPITLKVTGASILLVPAGGLVPDMKVMSVQLGM